MATGFTPRTMILSDSEGFPKLLREYLFRLGIQKTVILSNPQEVIDYIAVNNWPIIFIDCVEQGVFDSFGRFERIYAMPGFQLFTYVLCGPAEDRRYASSTLSLGASAWLQKPIQPTDAATLMEKLIPKANDPWYEFALKTSKLILQNETAQLPQFLTKLGEHPGFQRAADIASLHLHIRLEQFSRAEQLLEKLLEKYNSDLRSLCEAASFYRKVGQVAKSMEFYRKIRKKVDLSHRIWEHLLLAMEINDLDTAAEILEDLAQTEGQREYVSMGTARIMSFMGLDEYVPLVLKNYPNQMRIFEKYQQTGQQQT